MINLLFGRFYLELKSLRKLATDALMRGSSRDEFALLVRHTLEMLPDLQKDCNNLGLLEFGEACEARSG